MDDRRGEAIVEFVRLGFGPANSLSFEVDVTNDWDTFSAAIHAIGGYNAFAAYEVVAQFRPLWDQLAYVKVGRYDGSPSIQTHLPVITGQENGHRLRNANRSISVQERRDLAERIVTAAKRAKADAICCYQAGNTEVETGGRVGANPVRVWLWWD
jgi:hypothetical protein